MIIEFDMPATKSHLHKRCNAKPELDMLYVHIPKFIANLPEIILDLINS
jgi:hypothetical protein